MKNVNLIVEKERMSQTDYGQIISPIYFDFGKYAFPEIGWFDSVVAILIDWILEIEKLNLEIEKTVRLEFLEGDFSLSVSRINGNTCNLLCLNETSGHSVEFSKKISIKKLRSEILITSKETVTYCRLNNLKNEDTSLLDTLVKKQS